MFVFSVFYFVLQKKSNVLFLTYAFEYDYCSQISAYKKERQLLRTQRNWYKTKKSTVTPSIMVQGAETVGSKVTITYKPVISIFPIEPRQPRSDLRVPSRNSFPSRLFQKANIYIPQPSCIIINSL